MNEYSPSVPLCVFLVTLVWMLVSDISAPVTTAPEASLTVPRSEALISAAKAEEVSRKAARTNIKPRGAIRLRLMKTPSIESQWADMSLERDSRM